MTASWLAAEDSLVLQPSQGDQGRAGYSHWKEKPGYCHRLLGGIEAVLGVTPRVEFVSPRVGDVRSSWNDPALFKSSFPEVEAVDLDPAMAHTAAWLDEHHR